MVGKVFQDRYLDVKSIALQQEAMGAGDEKLMATIGAWLGWKYVLLSSLLACAAGSIVGGGAMAVGIVILTTVKRRYRY